MSEPTPLSVTVAARVRGLAAEKLITQTQLGERLGMTQSSVSKRFRGVTPWQLDELARVGRILDVPLSSILTTEALAAAS